MQAPRSPWRHRLETLWVVLGVGLLTVLSCSGGDKPAEVVPDSPLAFDKQAVTLRGVSADSSVTQVFLVLNRGKDVFTVGPPEVLSTDCEGISTEQGEFTLLPGGSVLLPVRIDGHRHANGTHLVRLTVPSSVNRAPPAILSVEMKMREADGTTRTGPRVNVDKELIETGDIPYDWPLHERFVLSNHGDGPLVFEGVPEIRTEDGC